MYYGDIRLGETIDIKFTTRRFTTGAPFVLAGSPAISAYVGNGTTQITAGITLSVDFDSVAGLNNVRVVASSGNGYATATNVALVITTGTVDSVSVVGEVVGTFSIECRSAVMPTTAARTLDVSAGGEAGLDWANIGSPTTAQNLSGTNIDVDQVVASVSGAVGSVTGAVGSVAAGGITAVSIAADAITAAKIADGAIDAATFAAGAINAAAIASDAITDAKVASDVTIASVTGAVGSVTGAVGSVTGNVGGNVAGSVASVTAGVTLANDAITAAKFDESTAFPLKADDAGSTQVARVGADGDTLETLSDQLDAKASQASVDDLPTNAELAAAIAALNNLSAAQVNTEVDTALADYDPPTRSELTTDTNSILSKLLKYVQLVLRKDAAIATDNATEVTAVNADAGSGAGAFANTTDSQEAIRDNMGTAQTGDSFARLGAPAGASVSADIAAIEAQTDDIGVAGAGLTALGDTRLANLDATVSSRLATAGYTTPPTVGAIADQVWEEAITDHSSTVGSTAEALGAAGSAGDPWTTALPGAYGAGSAGNILGNNLNATVSSRATPAQVNTEADTAIADAALATAANLATVAGFLDSEIAAILADTNELQTDWANGGRLDTILDARASVGDIPTAIQNADALLKRDMSAVTGESARSALNALRFLRNKWSITGGTLTVTKEDDTATAWTGAVTQTAGDPVSQIDPG